MFLLLAPQAALAQTDLLIVPFAGAKFAGRTTIAIAEPTASDKKITFGLSTMILTDKFLGVEGDVEQTPQFFGQGIRRTVTSSVVTTLTGNVVITVPKVITQESLRPYLVSGVGLMHARVTATHAVPVIRGSAVRPLFITAAGIPVTDAADLVRRMAGRYRLPDALRRADTLARTDPPALSTTGPVWAGIAGRSTRPGAASLSTRNRSGPTVELTGLSSHFWRATAGLVLRY